MEQATIYRWYEAFEKGKSAEISRIYPSGSTNTLFSNNCNSRAHEPNFRQFARKRNNLLLFKFMLFIHHISVASSSSVKCFSLYRPNLINNLKFLFIQHHLQYYYRVAQKFGHSNLHDVGKCCKRM